jgi:hypothetical protein
VSVVASRFDKSSRQDRAGKVVRLPVPTGTGTSARWARPAYAAAPFLAQIIGAGLARRGLAMTAEETDAAHEDYLRPAAPTAPVGRGFDRKV